MSEAEGQLADLLARVSRLEERLGNGAAPGAGNDEATAADLPNTWWLLEGLQRRGLDSAVAYAGTVPQPDGSPVRWQITESSTALLETDWASAAPTLAALGHPSRLRILQLVARGEARTAAELAQAEGLGTTGQIYHHLRQLVAGGWLRATTRGQHQVPTERLVPLLVVLSAADVSG